MMGPDTIPLSKREMSEQAEHFIVSALREGQLCAGGPYTERACRYLCEWIKAHEVFLTTSGTAALEMAAILLHIQDGDEVILPSFTFPSTANAFMLRGAKVVLSDICPQSLCLNIQMVESLLTPRTRIVVPVHYGGMSCDMESLSRLAHGVGFHIVEDCAHALGGQLGGKPLGSFGALAAFSFHQTKALSCGEGGALAINDSKLIRRSEIIFEKGTNRRPYLRGEVCSYNWQDIGSSFGLSELLAALLASQLPHFEQQIEKRGRLWRSYFERLDPWAGKHAVRLPHTPEGCVPAYETFWLLMPDRKHRDSLLSHLKQHGISAAFHYIALHLSPMGQTLDYQPDDLPVSKHVTETIIRLPFYASMSEAELERVTRAVTSYRW
ncbi:MAG: dTDP-4-amino-4,6-dideoxygalactose transaminase [Deltaproteobacteria bacterium]|nr:dTDP-4-amino-4,6-dideoxygalactose transaminase [Deltaproteobacteria bacterium]